MLLCLDLLQSRLKSMEIFPLSLLGFEPNYTALKAWDTRQKDGRKTRTECLRESHTNAQAVPPGIQEDIATAAGRGLCVRGSTRDLPKEASRRAVSPRSIPALGEVPSSTGSGQDMTDRMGWRPQCQPHCLARHWQHPWQWEKGTQPAPAMLAAAGCQHCALLVLTFVYFHRIEQKMTANKLPASDLLLPCPLKLN